MTISEAKALSFPRWFNTIGMWALGAIALFVGAQLKELTVSVQQLSRDLATVSAQLSDSRARQDRLEARQDRLEARLPVSTRPF